MTRFPSLFVSHGAPTLAIDDSPAHRFLKGYGKRLGRPEAILVVSAHWETDESVVQTTERPETIYDFYGFPQELYEIVYAAPGAPAMAQRAQALLEGKGLTVRTDPQRGFDHGAWVPLLLAYPDADTPVAQLSVQTQLGPEHHYRVGEALRSLRDEGVLIVGSGSLTHNLGEIRWHPKDDTPPDWVQDFSNWTAQMIGARRIEDLLNYRTAAPHGPRNHPTEEHFLPLFVALGAGGADATPERVHNSYSYGVLAMDVYAFH